MSLNCFVTGALAIFPYFSTHIIMLRSKEDINQCVERFGVLDSIYRRHNIRGDKMMYVDDSYGEFIPFFHVKSHEQIHYCNTLRQNIFKEGLLKSKKLRSKVHEFELGDENVPRIKCGLLFINCTSDRLVSGMIDNVELGGMLITTFECKSDNLMRGFTKASCMDGLHVYKRVDCPFHVKSGNLFDKHVVMKNKFEYKCTSDVDVSLNIFRVNENRIRVSGLMMDDSSSCQVEVDIYSIDSSNNVRLLFELNRPILCETEYEMPFEIGAKHDVVEQFIPRVICQTLNENITSSMHFKTILNIQMLNPQYSYEFYNGRDRRKFISEYYNKDVLDTYDGLVSGAFKADLFRYCWLYKSGGIYVDCKMIQRVPFSEIIDGEDTLYLCEDRIPNAYQNCLIGAQGRQGDMLRSIGECVRRYKLKINHRVSFGSLYHTGPYLFYHCMKEHATKAAFRGPFRDLTYSRTGIYCKNTGLLLFNVWFKDYYQNYTKIHGKKIWSQDWAEGNIYYSDKFNLENCEQYSIRVHPSESVSNLQDLKFVYKDGGFIYNNLKNNLRCQLFDEYQHIDQTVMVEKNELS